MTQEIISDKYRDSVNILKEWLTKQPHLPKNIKKILNVLKSYFPRNKDIEYSLRKTNDTANSLQYNIFPLAALILKKSVTKHQANVPNFQGDAYLTKFLACCNNNKEQARNLLDFCFTLRSQIPELFANRDPESDGLKRAFDIVLRDTNPDKFVYVDVMKGFFMVADFRLATDCDESDGEVPIFDMAGYSLKHLTKISLSILKKYMTYTQEAHPLRLREIHVVNVPSFLDKCLTLIKPFMKSEVSKAMHYHTPNSTTLYDYVPRDLLPEEYGGTLGKIDNLSSVWRKKIFDNRDFYLDESRWKVDETKRPTGNSNIKRTCNLEGSFRSLSID